MGDLPKTFKTSGPEKSSCKNCHFLSKSLKNRGGVLSPPESWTEDERFQFLFNRKHRHANELPVGIVFDAVQCYKKVWPPIINNNRYPTYDVILLEIEKKRTDCFFITHRPGMSFDTAEDLFRIENDNRQLKRAHWATVAGLIIAGLALIANLFVQ